MKNYIDELATMRMNPNPVSGKKSPHKAVMMLTVIDMVASGAAEGSRIDYGPELFGFVVSSLSPLKKIWSNQFGCMRV